MNFHLICIVCVEVGHNITRVDGVDVQVVVVVVIVVDIVVHIEDEREHLKKLIKTNPIVRSGILGGGWLIC